MLFFQRMKSLLLFICLLFIVPSIFASEIRILKRSERTYILDQSGLSENLKNLDELDKDLLILRAQKSSPEKLLEVYPYLNKNKLTKLQNLLKGIKQ